MKRNNLQRLALLAADLPESDLADVVDFTERLHKQYEQRKCSGCFWTRYSLVDRDTLSDLDLRFCRIEALADQFNRISEDLGDRIQLGAVMMLADEVEKFRAVLDELDI